MTAEDRIHAVIKFGFTKRQARFLVTVMLFGGLCVPRQYARFAGTAYGQKVNAFFDKLVQRSYATTCGCLHNRARLYHVQYRPLYQAIGEPRSRYRRPVPAGHAIERVMRLDSVLCYPELVWLATESEKIDFFTAAARSLPTDRLPHVTVGTSSARRVRLFPDDVRIGVDATGRVVCLYLVTSPFDDDFRAVLQRHGDLLHALPRWTVRLLFPRPAAPIMGAYQVAFRDELATPFAPTILDELRWYFTQVRTAVTNRTRLPVDARFRRAQHAFAAPRFRVLYRRWLTDGDAAFEVVSSPAIIDALADETGRVESEVLLIPYRHLSPLANPVRSVPQGVEEGAAEGDTWSAPSTPLCRFARGHQRLCPRLVQTRWALVTRLRRKELRFAPLDRGGGVFCRPEPRFRLWRQRNRDVNDPVWWRARCSRVLFRVVHVPVPGAQIVPRREGGGVVRFASVARGIVVAQRESILTAK